MGNQPLPLGQTTRYSYDAAGKLAQRTDPRANRFVYSYDAANRLTDLKHYQADGSLLRSTTQSWDANDNLIAWSDTDTTRPTGQQTSSASLTYDDANRKTGETVSYPTPSGGSYSLNYSQTHSLAAKKTRLTWPDGTPIDYGYSQHGELDSITIPGEGNISVNQFKWTAPLKTTLPGGSTQHKSYDGLLSLEGLQVKNPGAQNVLELGNSYGKLQQLKSRNRTDTVNSISSSKASSYQYDTETRLREASTDSGALGLETETFTLDLLGNRTAHSRQAGAWQYDANNRLIQRGSGACGDSAVVCYEWDAAGNLVKKTEGSKVTQYGYDALNRLVEVKNGAGQLIARYGYDPQDRRLWKEQYRDKAGDPLAVPTRSYFLYADEGLIAEATQAISLNADGSVTASAAPVISSQYGPRPESEFTTGTLFVKTKNSNGLDSFAYYHHDHLQTPVQATDKAGNVVWAASYEPFGRASITTPTATAEKPTISSNLRFPGQVEDVETGLHYNFRRYYDAETGRYVTQDPIGLDGGINLFSYVNGSPLLFTDPTGEVFPIVVVIGQLLASAARICARNPKLCRELYRCAKAPVTCKKRFCKIMRSDVLYHPVCDIPGCNRMTNPVGREIASKAASACLGLRLMVKSVCYDGKPDKTHDDQIRAAAEKVRDCARICSK